MSLTYPRTALAFLLTIGAVAVPCAAWYYAGQQQLEHEAVLHRKAVYAKSHKHAVILAERLATRFELLRESESRRAFYHYQNLFHDPKGASEGFSVSVSPLAQGSQNPMIEAHFQVDETGHLSLPSLNDEFPELGIHSAGKTECELLWKLQDVAVFSRLEMEEVYPGGSGSRWRAMPWKVEDEGHWEHGGYGASRDDAGRANAGEGTGPPMELEPMMGFTPHLQVVELSPVAWQQHLQANALYADLKFGTHDGAAMACRLSARETQEKVQVKVGPLGWHTLPVGDEPALVALRGVKTPAG
ncbi:MAG: hypothetical protein MI919_42075, partial [Holophagales bacterium]|nr:hypothetical protein [Holophagales bacterium]